MGIECDPIHLKNILAVERVMMAGTEVSSLPKPVVLSVSYFASGGGNHLYLIDADGIRYLARVNFYPLKNTWRIKEHEFACLKMLEPFDVAPRAHFIDAEGRFLEQHFIIVDFVGGDVLGTLDDTVIVSLADTLKRLHTSVVFDRPGNTLPPSEQLPYACGIFHEFADGDDKQIERYAHLSGIGDVVEPFHRIRAELGAWFERRACFDGCTAFSLCHADLKRENILQARDRILLIDWECAGSDIPETDIGRLFSGCSFTQAQEEMFLRHYYAGEPEPIARERIAAVRTVLDFFRIFEDYVLLGRKPWNSHVMNAELERFERTHLM